MANGMKIIDFFPSLAQCRRRCNHHHHHHSQGLSPSQPRRFRRTRLRRYGRRIAWKSPFFNVKTTSYIGTSVLVCDGSWMIFFACFTDIHTFHRPAFFFSTLLKYIRHHIDPPSCFSLKFEHSCFTPLKLCGPCIK